jgi:isopenicillin N synthase-like dioxygenase
MATQLSARQVTASDEIPVIDLGAYRAGVPGALEKAAAELDHACRDIGFFFIKTMGSRRS